MGSKASPLSPQHLLWGTLKIEVARKNITNDSLQWNANLQSSLILRASKCNLGSKKKENTKKTHQKAVTNKWLLLQLQIFSWKKNQKETAI